MKTHKIILSVILILIIQMNLIGQRNCYRDISELKEFKGYAVGNSGLIGSYNGLDYGISIYSKNDSCLIAFEQIINNKGKVCYVLLDYIRIKAPIKENYFSMITCSLNDKPDNEIVVICDKSEQKEYHTKILKAWRADRKLKKMITIDTKNIKCVNEGFERN